jgi:Protein of unknown function
MTNQDRHSVALPRRESVVDPRRRVSLAAVHRGEGRDDGRYLAAYRRLLARHKLLLRRTGIAGAVVFGLLIAGCVGLWWRLSNGPIQLDAITPWLASAIEENFGSDHRVEVGGTQIERTENGGAAVRIRDIVVRDPDGTVVASAPKAEVRVSGLSLFSGHMRAESFNLVGAEMAVRIESDGDVTVFAGANKHPIATATVPVAAAAMVAGRGRSPAVALPAPGLAIAPPATVPSADGADAQPHRTGDILAALLTWIDGIGESGLDGHDLRELGLKDGNLTVDDERTGKRWSFQNITLTLSRPHGGGVVVTLGSDSPDRPWGITAAIKPTGHGNHSIELEGRHVSLGDLLLASRLGDGEIQADMPLSASLRGEIGPDGIPKNLAGRIVADAGFISDGGGPDSRIDIDHAEFKFNWDAGSRALAVPFQILSGGNRITLMGEVDAPEQLEGAWPFKINGGTVLLSSPAAQGDPLILNHIAVSGWFDAAKRQISIGHGEIGNTEVGAAMSGTADYSSGDLRLTAGFAGTRMSVDALKRLWPAFVSTKVRDWFLDHLISGTVEHLDIAVNAPFNTLKASGPPVPDDGLAINAQATNCVIRPVDGLPPLHDADLNVHIVGRYANITLNKATADLPSGRKLVLSSGQFEVPDTAPHEPPARVHFKLDGPVPAAAELLAMDRLRDASGAPFDPATTRGNLSAAVTLAMPLKPDLPPGSTNYAIAVDATNFSADNMIMGQKVEAAALKVNANNQGFQIKGDVKIGGTPATLDYRKARGDNDAEVHLDGMLDETARNNFGLDPWDSISGSIPIRLAGRVGTTADRDGRFSVEADLTPAQIAGFMPGWVKPAGKPARATFTLTTQPQSIRIDDMVIEGAGGGVKGAVEMDGSGQLQSANFPSYGFADGDKASLKVDRGPDGTLRVVMRGEVYDGRGFVKAVTGGAAANAPGKNPTPDVDLDMKLGAVVGFNGEALRSVDLKMSRRAGEIRSFGLNAKIGRDATLTGELRARAGGRQVVALATNDGGALFRFTDVYSRMTGGQMVIAMDAPSATNPTQQGGLTVRDFVIHGEEQLERAVAQNGTTAQRNDMNFSSMRVDFTRTPGRVVLRDGVVRGPLLGATIDGLVDYTGDEVHLRGTLVPLYGPNNLLGQLPIVGLFLGGEKEGLVGITYEVVGKPGTPILRINPISALAPGLLRKVFEYPAAADPGAQVPPDNAR